MARAITFVSIQSVVNFLTLRPARYSSVTERHTPCHAFQPLSYVHRVEDAEENPGIFENASRVPLTDGWIIPKKFIAFSRHRVRCSTKTCVIGVCRVLQKTVFGASHSVLSVSLNPCLFPLVPPPVPSDLSLDVHRSRSPNSLRLTPFSLPGPLLSPLNSPKGLLFRYAHC